MAPMAVPIASSFGEGLKFQQIGTDQGLLSAPVPLKKLILAPAERADVIFDFGGHAGEKMIFRSDSFSIISFAFRPAK